MGSDRIPDLKNVEKLICLNSLPSISYQKNLKFVIIFHKLFFKYIYHVLFSILKKKKTLLKLSSKT